MNWEAIGAVGEILGAAAVVVTLLYLAVQIRQNTRATRSAAATARAEGWRAMNEPVWSNPEMADFLVSILDRTELSELSNSELLRLGYYLNSLFAGAQQVHGQWQDSLLSDEEWNAVVESLESTFRMYPVAAYWWTNDGRRFFTLSFAAFVNQLIERLGMDVDRVEELKPLPSLKGSL